MKRTINETDINRIIQRIILETEEDVVDMSKFRDYLPLLYKLNSNINMKEVITWFNENNVNYMGLNDLEMIIIYIARNS